MTDLVALGILVIALAAGLLLIAGCHRLQGGGR